MSFFYTSAKMESRIKCEWSDDDEREQEWREKKRKGSIIKDKLLLVTITHQCKAFCVRFFSSINFHFYLLKVKSRRFLNFYYIIVKRIPFSSDSMIQFPIGSARGKSITSLSLIFHWSFPAHRSKVYRQFFLKWY